MIDHPVRKRTSAATTGTPGFAAGANLRQFLRDATMSREDLEAYSALWIKLDRLWDEGKGETPEADAIRDESDGPWYRMTEPEQDEARRYSGDLDAETKT